MLKEANMTSQVPFVNCGCSSCGDMYLVIFKRKYILYRISLSFFQFSSAKQGMQDVSLDLRCLHT